MESTKESDLVTAVLMYAIRCLAEGDHVALQNMKFGPREIEALREMNVSDLYRVESLRAHCLDIALNRQVYWLMIDHLRVQRESEETLQSLIAADAPHEMLLILFGLNARDYGRLRRTLSVNPSVGRPPRGRRGKLPPALAGLVEPGRWGGNSVTRAHGLPGTPQGNRGADARYLEPDPAMGPSTET